LEQLGLLNVRFLALGGKCYMAEMVKVFGRRPSQFAGVGTGRRTETAQARTRGAMSRHYGDLKIPLPACRRRGDCKVLLGSGAGWSGRRAVAQLTRCDDGRQADLAFICTTEALAVDAAARPADGRSAPSTIV